MYFGEVGLLGEVKPVSFADKRKDEIKKRGYEYKEVGKSISSIVKGL